MAKRVSSYVKKRLNFGDIRSSLRLLCLMDERGSVTQPEAAERLSMSTGTCNLHFQRLEHEGLIRRKDKISGGRGRPTLVWELHHEKNLCITLVFDVPYFQGTLLDFAGRIVSETRVHLGRECCPAVLMKHVHTFLQDAEQAAHVSGREIRQVFAAVPGLMDRERGVVTVSANLPALEGLDLGDMIRDRYPWPCHVAGLGPAFYYGETRNLRSDARVMMIHWDLGLGVQCGVGRQLLSIGAPGHGQNLCFEEISHMKVADGSRACHCGREGCLETLTGGWAIIRELDDPEISTLPDLVVAAVRGRVDVLEAIAKAARLLGRELAWPIQLMGADCILISGPMAPAISRVGEAFVEGLSGVFPEDDLARLVPRVSDDPVRTMQFGAYLFAKRLFLHPEEF